MTTNDTGIKREDEIVQESDDILAAFERVREAREKLIARRKAGRHYKGQTVERNWKSPVKDD
jgi:hypothetical protein